MSQTVITRRLRPYLFTSYRRSQLCLNTSRHSSSTSTFHSRTLDRDREVTNDYERRVSQLEAVSSVSKWYPRQRLNAEERTPIAQFRREYDGLKAGETEDQKAVTIAGRIHSLRTAGSKLVFLDLKQGDSTIQAIVQSNKLEKHPTTEASFNDFTRIARKGDWYSIHGHPHRSPRGELSLLALEIPQLLSPSLHQIPEALEAAETRAKTPHVDMLVNRSAIQILAIRHLVTTGIADYFNKENFTAVSTPILSAGAGGAVARPFETQASELEGQKLNLRIAPELWLKRLVVGGLDKVYEIGPAFRNEGVDATHNPEFYICEFYEAFATLDDLIKRTEALLCTLSSVVATTMERTPGNFNALPPIPTIVAPFAKLQFLPTLARELNHPLPDLTTPSPVAQKEILKIFTTKNLSPPSNPTLPRLLDALASIYLEPLCQHPTFITHHPACLSPLSKHFLCPTTHQTVAARAELFVQGREVANMYEEENSPWEQRRKFREQHNYRGGCAEGGDSEVMEVDEGFLEALEWGLPPTGGWGCGVDRLVMLFSGQRRLGDVLAFGSLRNVVGLGGGRGRRGREGSGVGG